MKPLYKELRSNMKFDHDLNLYHFAGTGFFNSNWRNVPSFMSIPVTASSLSIELSDNMLTLYRKFGKMNYG